MKEIIFNTSFTKFDTDFKSLDNVSGSDFDVLVVNKVSEVEEYAGSYEVIPKTFEQTLATKDKYLKQDIAVKGVRASEVSNSVGGTTFYIGEMT